MAVSKKQITVKSIVLCASCSATITYSDVSAPSVVGTSTFAASAGASGKKTKPLAASPGILVGEFPPAPTITSVAPGVGQLTVAFSPVTPDPGVSEYVVTCGSQTESTTYATPVTISGLEAGVEVECTVYAKNELGSGPSATAVPGTPEFAAPGEPTINSVTVGNGELTVGYSAPESGGPINGYTAACGSDSTTVGGSTLTATVTGLTNGSVYSCTLLAHRSRRKRKRERVGGRAGKTRGTRHRVRHSCGRPADGRIRGGELQRITVELHRYLRSAVGDRQRIDDLDHDHRPHRRIVVCLHGLR